MSGVARLKTISHFEVTIPAGNTLDVDSGSFDAFRSFEYKLDLFSIPQDKFKTLQMLARRTGSNVSDQVYGKNGDPLLTVVNFLVDGPDVILRISNGESFPITVRGRKFN